MTTTPTPTDINRFEHEMLSERDRTAWLYSHHFALRTVISAIRVLNQSAKDLADEVAHHEEPFLACVAALKMIQSDEIAALRRAHFASRAREALTQAIAARNDPRTQVLMQGEIDFNHVPAMPKTLTFMTNDIRIDPDSGGAAIDWTL